MRRYVNPHNRHAMAAFARRCLRAKSIRYGWSGAPPTQQKDGTRPALLVVNPSWGWEIRVWRI